MPHVVRINYKRTKGAQARVHGGGGICMKATCRCRKKASKFFAARLHGGWAAAEAAARKWLRGGR